MKINNPPPHRVRVRFSVEVSSAELHQIWLANGSGRFSVAKARRLVQTIALEGGRAVLRGMIEFQEVLPSEPRRPAPKATHRRKEPKS